MSSFPLRLYLTLFGFILAILLGLLIIQHPVQFSPRFYQQFANYPKVPTPRLKHVLRNADWINIGYISNKGIWSATTISINKNSALLNGKSVHPEMLALLRKSSRFHAAPPTQKRDFMFSVFVYGGRPRVEDEPLYFYVSQTGELGTGNDWCYVPAEFKTWMIEIKAGLASKRGCSNLKPAFRNGDGATL